MKKYNVQNYLRYKNDLEECIERIGVKDLKEYTRDELIIKFMPSVEDIARKFSTSDQASGVMDITDLIQSGNAGLIMGVDRINWDVISDSTEPEKTLYAFLAKRIKGAIRRDIDMNRGDIRIPEHKLNEIRKDNGKDHKMVEMFFNSVFLSIDNSTNDDDDLVFDVEDKSKPYNIDLMNKYLLSLMRLHLDDLEFNVLRLSYGLDCDKTPGKTIAEKLDLNTPSGYVRVSQIKREAIDKLIDSVDADQVLDFL